MSDGEREDLELQAVAGVLSSGVARELALPLRELRENLALMVETLDRYTAEARGPTPYPWKSLQTLRQELADSYLLSRTIARLASDLADGVSARDAPIGPVEVNRQVEAALALSRHRITSATEVFVDLGSVPSIDAVHGEIMLGVAKMLMACAESAAAVDGSAISIKTRRDSDGVGDMVVVYIADNGRGHPGAAVAVHALVGPLAARFGGTFEGTSEEGAGSVYELRIPARTR